MYLKKLISSKKSVFNVYDLRLIWQLENKNYLKTLINRMVKSGKLLRIKRGIYSINVDYNIFELANKLKKPSYISLETVLQKNGIIFQDYSNSVYSVSNNSLQTKINKINFNYSKLADNILFNPLGISNKNNFAIAEPERALTDRIYLTPNYYFDNLRNIDTKKLKKLSKIYNKRTEEEILKIINFINKKYA